MKRELLVNRTIIKSRSICRRRAHKTVVRFNAILLFGIISSTSGIYIDTSQNTNIMSVSSRLRSIPKLIVRGGSDGASAWNAGSRYDYRTAKPSTYNRGQSMKQQLHPATVEDDTKEAIANAFLNREDRNRFIGERSTRF